MATDQYVDIDGRRLKLTSLDRVLYPETGTTKAEVLDYYARIAEVMIPYTANRPATRKRWVNGVGTAANPGEVFFQKNLDSSTPSWVQRQELAHSSRTSVYPLVNDRATLAWLGQISALEVHVPQWRFGADGQRQNPDRLVLDLDPGPGTGLPECAEVARLARVILAGMGLEPFPVTSGSKGIHLYAALDGSNDSDAVSAIAHELARALEADHPDLIVSDMKKSRRNGKVLVDWSQNSAAKTTIAPYSLRGRPQPTVAAPRTWEELDSPDLAQLHFRDVLERVKRIGDPLVELQSTASSAGTAQQPAVGGGGAGDRLSTYRSMRDANKTPEPMGADQPAVGDAGAGAGAGAPIFVIQEHHARRLHYDFRLEHDGVLVSWAIPKGVPTDPGQNHLAVQTEDHPMEYATFEGEIPAGEYGGGTVTIWDSGTFELEKWRDGKEVIAVLHGRKHGTHRYALIHTGGRGGSQANNWLIHLMKDSPAKTSARGGRKIIGAGPSPERHTLRPMLATLGDEAQLRHFDAEGGWAYEMKWDGIRALAHVFSGSVRLMTRNGNDVTATYPELAGLAERVDGDCIIDGEIVALDRTGRPDFGVLQSRMNLADQAEITRMVGTVPVHFMAFDLLEHGGRSLMDDPYESRRERLEQAVNPGGMLQLPPAFPGDSEAALASSRELGLEGVMAKRRDSRYSPGRRSSHWVKVKHQRAQEVVVIGWKPGNGRRADTVGSLLLAVPDGDGFRYCGKVGTGFSDRQLQEIHKRLVSRRRTTAPAEDVPAVESRDAHWVEPQLVGEVQYTEWTSTGRLRHPTWRGWRPDKAPRDVIIEG